MIENETEYEKNDLEEAILKQHRKYHKHMQRGGGGGSCCNSVMEKDKYKFLYQVLIKENYLNKNSIII